ncbi:MAG: DUF2330 domain-containing protein [Polyangiaceae bacterium]|nr:DUF2330 domain-containing protein [Polyangiaceae bacterium]
MPGVGSHPWSHSPCADFTVDPYHGFFEAFATMLNRRVTKFFSALYETSVVSNEVDMMKNRLALGVGGLLAAAALLSAPESSACGGCFSAQTENTQVSGHRMILSISQQETTLWDQIVYTGEPESFAWVLPIADQVDLGLSSDVLFQALDVTTGVVIRSPPLCPNTCLSNGGYSLNADVAGGEGVVESVEVLKQETVGPYETVQLSSSDPLALKNWLSNHGYNVPADVEPVIDHYVSTGFNFLALKLVPGAGVSAMRPVRITFPGAVTMLPLKMIAAGTGQVTPLKLWVFGEGRYEPTNFPSSQITEDDLVWNWDEGASNYTTFRKEKFNESGGFLWLTDAAWPFAQFFLHDFLDTPDGLASYADADGTNAEENRQADMDALFKLEPSNYPVVTALSTELSRKALSNDLQLGASANQDWVDNVLVVTEEVGTKPPASPPCPPDPCAPISSLESDLKLSGLDVNTDSVFGGGVSCGIATEKTVNPVWIGALLGLAALGGLRFRRRSKNNHRL